MTNVTALLSAASAGDPKAAADLLPLVYDELRKLAAARMAAESPDHTLQPTALVHEAYVRLVGASAPATWNGRSHFFAAAAEAMRRVLIEAARRKSTRKRGERPLRTALDPEELSSPAADADQWLDLNDALTRFEAVDAAAAGLAKLRLFGGLSVEEAGEALGLSRASAFRLWTYARAWLSADLAEAPKDS
ncbi:ECF-type sigma factor [Fimbriiglobus ruber]|uniref:RNA polymerase sigma-70 ECF-like protein n=1 Tax=Fimbriiglobus ruber TaxID=1908690 RepID=A0A225DN53_9BACT|nr:ECF-type sigma factor [Fimbriiglobus ruber]OWK37607.1 RNA polymerase sigma-70 ECF-like protein [Fimbriiglobus ruber]